MKAVVAGALGFTLIFGTAPVRADFKYTDTSKITGGTVKSMMKTVGMFSKQASAAMKPIVTTHYVKGDKLRTDNADGTIQIIDLAARKFITIDPAKHTYSEATFEEIKAAMEKAQQQAQAKMAEQKAKDPQQKDVQANVKAKVYVTPTTGTREIMGQQTKELKMQIDMEVQAQDTSASAQPAGPVSGTISTNIDSWVAPGVPGYKELGEFYVKMAKEINWVPPSNIHLDPQVSQGMEEVQKNQAAFKGLPLLQYMTMTMAGQQGASATTAQNSSTPTNSSPSSSSSSVPTSASDAMVKGLGGLFAKKKKKDDAAAAEANANSQNPAPPSTPGSLIEMTIEVNSFSDSALDAGLFAPPAGFTKVEHDPDDIFGRKAVKH